MAGRGRGRGAAGRSQTTFTVEQLNNMGLGGPGGMRAELKQGEIGPPPVFPLLMNKPGPLSIDIKEQYLLMIKRDIVEYLRESSVMQTNKSAVEKSIVQPYGNKYVEILNEKPENSFVWMHLPVELRPNVKRKAINKSEQPNKKIKNIDIDNRLKILEQRELKGDKSSNATGGGQDGEHDGKDQDEDGAGGGNEETAELGEGDDQPDEEMDMGTDYVNDYFDNGEGFEDEDDNLDEPCF